MAITNRDIMQTQLRRINEKAGTNLLLRKASGHWYLCREVNGNELEPYPFSGTKTRRTSAQMLEYLAGLEDAVDTLPKKVYFIKCEVNDHGWHTGYHHFTCKEDAIKLMRRYVARQIWFARSENKKVFLKVQEDSVMDDRPGETSQTIFTRIGEDTFEYRIWAADILYNELPKDMSFHY